MQILSSHKIAFVLLFFFRKCCSSDKMASPAWTPESQERSCMFTNLLGRLPPQRAVSTSTQFMKGSWWNKLFKTSKGNASKKKKQRAGLQRNNSRTAI